MSTRRFALVALLCALVAGCAGLGALSQAIQAPRFAVASERPAQLRLLAPTLRHPLGAAEVQLWARVSNPNPFGLTLAALSGTLALENTEAAEVDFPLGLPLAATQDTVIPLNIAVSLTNLPALAELLPRAVGRGAVDYRLNGSFSVDAGVLGQPSFGPMTLLQGQLEARR